jgi:parallel beta-helix repeat protein
LNWETKGNWNQENNQVHSGKYSADFDGQFLGRSGDLITPKIDTLENNIESIYVEFWGFSQEADKGEYFLDYYNGKTWNEIRRLDNFGRYRWQKYNHTITDLQYLVHEFRVRWRVVNLGLWEHVYVDDVTIKLKTNISGYAIEGNLISEIHDTTQSEPIYTQIVVNKSQPNGTSVITWMRAAENKTSINDSTWYKDINKVPNKRFIQWRVNLSGDKENTPIINSVNITWYYEDIPQPTIVYIDDDFNSSTPGWNYDHFSNIQKGINAVAPNGSVIVFNGTYYEFVLMNKTLALVGEHPEGTIIDGGGSNDVLYLINNSIKISNFTITHSGGPPIGYAAIRILSNGCKIYNNIIKNNYHGIYCYYSSNNTIHCNVIVDNEDSAGILLLNSSNNNISSNQIESNFYGIQIDRSSNNTCVNNTISNNIRGILAYYSSYNFLKKNNITHNNYGIRLLYSSSIHGETSDNIIIENTISHNRYSGLETDNASNNYIFHNNFINNQDKNAKDSSVNTWDDGYPSGGNYWSDYTGNDSNGDGIGDTPYTIPNGENSDRYPLMHPYGIDVRIPIVEIITPEMNYLYVNFYDLLELRIPFFTTIIIGKIAIEVEASDPDSGIERVDFFINDKLKESDTSSPYKWTWKDTSFLLPYKILVKAYDNTGNYNTDSIDVWKFF